MKIVPATAALAEEYYGKPMPVSMRAYFLLDDDSKPIGLSGFLRVTKQVKVIFSEGKEEAYRDKKLVMKFAKMMMDIADENGWTLIAQVDENIPTAPRFLKHLGFILDETGEYVRWPDLQLRSHISQQVCQ